MKRKLLLIIVVTLLVLLSGCSIIDSYVLKGYHKILIEDGYEYSDNIDNLNILLQNFIYQEKEKDNTIEYENGSYLIKENDIYHLYSPNQIIFDVYKNDNNILIKYHQDNNDYYIFKDLKTYIKENDDYEETDHNDISIINIDNGYRIVLDDNNYYEVNNNYEIKEKFVKQRTYFVSSYFSDRGMYFKQEEDHICVYFPSLKPSDYFYDLQSAYFKVSLIRSSCLNNPSENKEYYAISKLNDCVLKFKYACLGKENMLMTYVEIYDNQINYVYNNQKDTNDDWNNEVKNVLNDKFNCVIPFINLGKSYKVSNDYKEDEKNDFDISDKYIKISDNYYLYLLDDYKQILLDNGFKLYEAPADLVYNEEDNYTDWITAYNMFIKSEECKYFDAYINENLGIFIKLDYDIKEGNIIKVYKYTQAY